MTPAQVAAQMAVDAANNQKSRCELPVDSEPLSTIYVSWAFTVVAVSLKYCMHFTVKLYFRMMVYLLDALS